MKKRITNLLLLVLLLAGLSLMLYPTVSNAWNARHATQAIAAYNDTVTNDTSALEEMLAEAEAYNQELAESGQPYALTAERKELYNELLNINGTGIMGYIEIPKLNVSLPVYHSTDDNVLQVAAGHLEWTSLPVGGESTHAVLSGHRGLPSAKLFTDLDQMEEGDRVTLYVLGRRLTYEVDDIRIVLPTEVNTLKIQEGEDLCTLVTCTPYGVNTHRLLVTGHRVENEAASPRLTADALKIDPILVAPFVALPILLVLFLALMLPGKKKPGSFSKEENQ